MIYNSVGKEVVPDKEPRVGFIKLILMTSGSICTAEGKKHTGIQIIITIKDLESFD